MLVHNMLTQNMLGGRTKHSLRYGLRAEGTAVAR
jgi:hypothetical protein